MSFHVIRGYQQHTWLLVTEAAYGYGYGNESISQSVEVNFFAESKTPAKTVKINTQRNFLQLR